MNLNPLGNGMDATLRIAELPVGIHGGILGLSLAPGKKGPSVFGSRHVRDLDEDLDIVRDWGAAVVVTLMEGPELDAFAISGIGEGVRRRFMEWHHLPIVDGNIPDAAFEAAWPDVSARLRALLLAGNRVFVHCRGGLGRAGMVSARLLAELGIPPDLAITDVRTARNPMAIETRAQEEWVRDGKEESVGPFGLGERDRAVGAMVGLAVGDAVGTTLEFTAKPEVPVLFDMVGGGPFSLAPGQWTDDTAMSLALADSLLRDHTLDLTDLMNRFVNWREHGQYSCTGACFDIGVATSRALDRYLSYGDPRAGSELPTDAGNGCVMRMAPVSVRFRKDWVVLFDVAKRQATTTHRAPEAIEYSGYLADIVADAISGIPLHELVTGGSAADVRDFRVGQPRDEVRGTGYVVDCVHAALWAVSRTTSFESAVLMAANLGQDADTTAAVAGQIAGAVYGLSGIPKRWLDKLAWREEIERKANALFDASELDVDD